MPRIEPETSKKFEVFVVFDAISVHFLNDFVLGSNTINSTTKERILHYKF